MSDRATFSFTIYPLLIQLVNFTVISGVLVSIDVWVDPNETGFMIHDARDVFGLTGTIWRRHSRNTTSPPKVSVALC